MAGDLERATYFGLLDEYLGKSDWKCLAYALMSNHIHLALVAGAQPVASWLRDVHRDFAEWINRRLKRIGSVFVKGPKDFVVYDEDVSKVIAYIHNNPVRAGVVRYARDSAWTSHGCYLGTAPVPSWLDVEEGRARMNITDPEEFDEFVNRSVRRRDVYPMRPIGRPRKAEQRIEPTPIVDAWLAAG